MAATGAASVSVTVAVLLLRATSLAREVKLSLPVNELSERHLMRLLRDYFACYHQDRAHQSLKGSARDTRAVEPPEQGRVIGESRVGGLHHRYCRAG